MPANLAIRMDERGLKIPVKDGSAVRIATHRCFSNTAPWHNSGDVVPGGVKIYDPERPYARSAYTHIDAPVFMKDGHVLETPDTYDEVEALIANGANMVFDLDTELYPLNIDHAGHKIWTEFAAVMNHGTRLDDEGNPSPHIMNKTVRTGMFSQEEWDEYNPTGRPYTRSKRYEVLTPRKAFAMMRGMLYEDTGLDMKAHSAGALGKNGEKGVWMSIPLPRWDSGVTALIETDVKDYITLYVDPIGNIYVVQSTVMVVCENTWMMALANASRRLYVDHSPGIEERVQKAMRGIWDSYKQSQMLVQDTVAHLAQSKLEPEQVELAAQAMFPYRGVIDRELEGRSVALRLSEYRRAIKVADAHRQAFKDLYYNPKQAEDAFGVKLGIGPSMEGTAFAAMQVATWMASVSQGEETNRVKDYFVGKRIQGPNRVINGLMAGGEIHHEHPDEVTGEWYDTTAISGVGYPEAVMAAYDSDMQKAASKQTVFRLFDESMNN